MRSWRAGARSLPGLATFARCQQILTADAPLPVQRGVVGLHEPEGLRDRTDPVLAAGGAGRARTSIVDVPAPGCWTLDLRWADRTDTLRLNYQPG